MSLQSVRERSLLYFCCSAAFLLLCCGTLPGESGSPAKSDDKKDSSDETCSQWLARGAETCILKSSSNYVKIRAVTLAIIQPGWGGPGYDLLGVGVSIQTAAGWEGVVHYEMVLRKHAGDTTWANAEIYFFNPGGRAVGLWKWFELGGPWEHMRTDLSDARS